ncbi:hypothetical protein HK097_010406 [Rhizophlyctis rosea]|uniref:Uncharacterized protein n=1 Tax=Rhizophlyctis rosea TaxID=64517 RepID=A0AAD5SKC7_9FUNG|nr:hypothetical protein HK097_010406 [Rhizophlyctis rosea]
MANRREIHAWEPSTPKTHAWEQVQQSDTQMMDASSPDAQASQGSTALTSKKNPNQPRKDTKVQQAFDVSAFKEKTRPNAAWQEIRFDSPPLSVLGRGASTPILPTATTANAAEPTSVAGGPLAQLDPALLKMLPQDIKRFAVKHPDQVVIDGHYIVVARNLPKAVRRITSIPQSMTEKLRGHSYSDAMEILQTTTDEDLDAVKSVPSTAQGMTYADEVAAMQVASAGQGRSIDSMDVEAEEKPPEVSATYHADVAELQKRHGPLLATKTPDQAAGVMVTEDGELAIDLRIDTRALSQQPVADQQPMPPMASQWYAAPAISAPDLFAARISRECDVWAARAKMARQNSQREWDQLLDLIPQQSSMTGAPVRELKRIVEERIGLYLPPPPSVKEAVKGYHDALAATAAESSPQSGMPYGATAGPFGPYRVPFSQPLGPPVNYGPPDSKATFAYSTPHASVFSNPTNVAARPPIGATGSNAPMAQGPAASGARPAVPQAVGPFRYQ